MWFVYVLECDDGSYYKGFTKDVLERWKQHAKGTGAEWTAKHPPRKLVHWEEFSSESAAVEREKELKTGFGRKWLERETLWLNQNHLADLLETELTSVLKHIRNIYETGELSENTTCAKFVQVQKEGKRSVT